MDYQRGNVVVDDDEKCLMHSGSSHYARSLLSGSSLASVSAEVSSLLDIRRNVAVDGNLFPRNITSTRTILYGSIHHCSSCNHILFLVVFT